jgi:hypothetical protein
MVDDGGARPLPVPRPRLFPVQGAAPGPRCGHTLTAIAGPDGDLSKAKLVLFGACAGRRADLALLLHADQICVDQKDPWVPLLAGGATALEGSSAKGAEPPPSPGPAATGAGHRGSMGQGCRCTDARMLTEDSPPPQPSQASAWPGRPTTCTSSTSALGNGRR